MKYSIIIPTLNEEKLLSNLLRQLTGNSLKDKYNFEIIISDGGSTDRTIEISQNLVDKVIVHNEKRKQNISEGRNKGAAQADGEVFIFLNGDVEISNPDLFFKLVDTFHSNPEYLAMTCKVLIHPDKEIFSDKLFLSFYNLYFHLLNIIGIGMGRGECHIIRKNVFTSMNGYNEKLAAGEDFDLFKRIRKKGKILFSRKICVYESPRRYRKYGHVPIFISWLVNSIYVIFAKRSLSNEWEAVR